jgi:DNA modification methylase
MIRPIEANPYAKLDLSIFASNMALPRHRWYELKEGFSETLIRTAVTESSSPSKRKMRLLDPFSGSGTTLVSAGRLGVKATGIEVSPFLAFASRAKCVNGGGKLASLERKIEQVLLASRYEIRSPLEGMSTFTEYQDAKKWLFNRSVLRGVSAIDRAINGFGYDNHPLKLALLAAAMDCCNAKRDGKCLRYKKDWEKTGLGSADIRACFKKRAQIICDDLSNYPFDSDGIAIIQGDCRNKLRTLDCNSHDLLITSPPYLNSFDYSDVYRPELFLGGFVRTNEELRKIRLETIRSHVQVSWLPATVMTSAMIPQILSQLREKDLWSKKIPAMIQSYFADMATVLSECARIIRRGGHAWIVVSTSAYGGVEIPVDLILADIAVKTGWKLRSINVLREMRAAGQHWAYLEPRSRLPLRESLIILKRA